METTEVLKAVVQVIAACGALAATVLTASNGKRSRERDENVAQLLSLMTAVGVKVDGLVSRFDKHEASMTVQVGDLRADMEEVKSRLHEHGNRITAIEAKGRKR